ncbi:MAG: MBL fold metallo-hydrolase [Victivallales bacterium]|nr:MBL fold metallo-hydrolase [Victivallales bacterium]
MSVLTLRILCVVDNSASGGLLGEHGLSFLVESGGKRMLFDCGAGGALAHNARCLGVREGSLDALVLSHGHHDHTGGLEHALELLANDGRIVFHPAALKPKYSSKGGMHYIGISDACRERLMSCGLAKTATKSPVELWEGITTSGEIPRVFPEEKGSGNFFSDYEGQVPDTLPDDLSLFIPTKKGVVILSGCCHAGMANTMEHAAKMFGVEKIHAFIGGTHLSDADDERLAFSAGALRSYGIELFAPCHCTGDAAKSILQSELPDIFHRCAAGILVFSSGSVIDPRHTAATALFRLKAKPEIAERAF